MSVQATAPLAGVTVIEVGVFIAAPYATMQLADLGARVLKVETPTGGDPVRGTGPFVEGQSSPFARLNRNKESVALDLKHPQGKAAFLRLTEQADVVVENLRPGAMRSLGLGYDDVRAVNPRIVYASASGWGQDGKTSARAYRTGWASRCRGSKSSTPAWSSCRSAASATTGPQGGRAGYDQIAQGEAGPMSLTGPSADEPMRVGVPIGDLLAGMYGAFGVASALVERAGSGRGTVVRTSLLAAIVGVHAFPGTRYTVAGEVPHAMGNHHPPIPLRRLSPPVTASSRSPSATTRSGVPSPPSSAWTPTSRSSHIVGPGGATAPS